MKFEISPDSEVLFEKIKDLETEIPEFDNPSDFFGFTEKYRLEVIFSFIEKGVRVISTDGVVISPFAEIGAGTVIHPNTEIRHGVRSRRRREDRPVLPHKAEYRSALRR